jgi:hypothetical protein
VLALIPQIGSPFAITFGGEQLSRAAAAYTEVFRTLAAKAHSIAASASIEASFQRRAQEWKHQLMLAKQELKQVKQQCLAAEIRQLIAEKDLEMLEKNIEQAEELDEFYKNKFTNLGLYNYLATNLNRLYYEAYNMAYEMARMAEKAYQFERDDNTSMFVASDNWQYDRAGLLAGERLLLQLQRMEKIYIENNVRDFEITQSFSMALLSPDALLDLRQKGKCEFTIPEIAFDLFYPGQYKRFIKSVRLSIPCVVGPFTNISATLTLKNSWIRRSIYGTGTPPPMEIVTAAQNNSISTSSAQNDAGVFELNFHDERYLPFEGAGAVSKWELVLPNKLRSFNYDTISDVIVHISYTAKYGGDTFREDVETGITNMLNALNEDKGLYRIFSMKHEFSSFLYKLLSMAGAAQAEFDITKQHFPYFLSDKGLTLSEVKVYLKPKGNEAVTMPGVFKINSQDVVWENELDIGILKGGEVNLQGDIIKRWSIETGGLSNEVIDDILIFIRYRIL